jgi:hypothetical protein
MSRRCATRSDLRRRSAAWKHRPGGRTKERKRSMLRRCSVKDAVAWTSSSVEPPQEAPQEYSQSRRAAQVVRLQAGKTGRNRRGIHRDRSGDRAAGERDQGGEDTQASSAQTAQLLPSADHQRHQLGLQPRHPITQVRSPGLQVFPELQDADPFFCGKLDLRPRLRCHQNHGRTLIRLYPSSRYPQLDTSRVISHAGTLPRACRDNAAQTPTASGCPEHREDGHDCNPSSTRLSGCGLRHATRTSVGPTTLRDACR